MKNYQFSVNDLEQNYYTAHKMFEPCFSLQIVQTVHFIKNDGGEYQNKNTVSQKIGPSFYAKANKTISRQ